MTHPMVIRNLCIKKELPMFFNKKDINRTWSSGETGGQADRVISISPITLFAGDIKKNRK